MMMAKCKIQWIDAQGNPTPDDNDAIGLAYRNDEETGYPICEEHAKRLVPVHVSWPGTDHEVVTRWRLVRMRF